MSKLVRMEKRYLGDGAYVEPGSYPFEIVLTTSDGVRDTNRVVLGPCEWLALTLWVDEWSRELKEGEA